MKLWQQLYRKTEADPPKSMAGCLLAYALLLLIGLTALYLAGATFRFLGN